MYTIHIKFLQKDLPPVTLTNIAPSQSLLQVLLDNNIELHHNCGMVCACSTCHLYVENEVDFLPDISDKEEDRIDRAAAPQINSRLACQCILAQGTSGEIYVTIPDQTQFLGE